jgi:hypothetical protein
MWARRGPEHILVSETLDIVKDFAALALSHRLQMGWRGFSRCAALGMSVRHFIEGLHRFVRETTCGLVLAYRAYSVRCNSLGWSSTVGHGCQDVVGLFANLNLNLNHSSSSSLQNPSVLCICGVLSELLLSLAVCTFEDVPSGYLRVISGADVSRQEMSTTDEAVAPALNQG